MNLTQLMDRLHRTMMLDLSGIEIAVAELKPELVDRQPGSFGLAGYERLVTRYLAAQGTFVAVYLHADAVKEGIPAGTFGDDLRQDDFECQKPAGQGASVVVGGDIVHGDGPVVGCRVEDMKRAAE